MSAIVQWNQIINKYRKASLNNGNHWRGEHAQWYDGWVKENNYAEVVYPIFQPFVQGNVVEIGAGTGLFTQYLMQDADHVDVLEPSGDMLDLLKQNIANQHKLSCYTTTIESFDFHENYYDFAFAAHAFFNILHIDEVLKDILNHCAVLGVLIGSGKPLDIFQGFHDEHLVEEERAHPPSHQDLIPVLDDCGFNYDVRFIHSLTKYAYESEAVLLEKIAMQCGIRESGRKVYRTLLAPYIKMNERGYYVLGSREHVCLLISKTVADFHNCTPAK